jgi:hypothetical protein
MTMDIKDFYLNIPMAQYKYMQLQIADMPNDVIKHYNLTDLANQTDTSTARSKRECTAFHRLESLPRNCLRNDYDNMDAIKAK